MSTVWVRVPSAALLDERNIMSETKRYLVVVECEDEADQQRLLSFLLHSLMRSSARAQTQTHPLDGCTHLPWGSTGHCAVMSCPNYVNKHLER